MLKHTFIHIPGVGEKTERWLWRNKILCWEDCLKNFHQIKLPKKMHATLSLFARLSINALLRGDISFFKKLLPETQLWRVYPEFKEKTAFLDIETTGIGEGKDYVTVIGLFDGKKTHFFIQGENIEDFPKAIKKYSIIVTYNGEKFDLPFLKATFSQLDFPQVHIDLRYILKRLGYSGGLKKIEKMVGIERSEMVKNFNGYDAVILWNRYLDGEPEALRLLLNYNREDVVNLKYLIELACQKMLQSLPISFLKEKKILI